MELKPEYRSQFSPEALEVIDAICAEISEVDELIYETVDTVSVVLRLHALTESYLRKIIELSLPSGKTISNDSRFSYHHILTVVSAMGVLDSSTIGTLKKLNKLRNQLARQVSPIVDLVEIQAIGQNLGGSYVEEIQKHDGNAVELTALCVVLIDTVRKPTKLLEQGFSVELIRSL